MVICKIDELKANEYYFITGQGICLYAGPIQHGVGTMYSFITVTNKTKFALDWNNITKDAIVFDLPTTHQIENFFVIFNAHLSSSLSLSTETERHRKVQAALLSPDLAITANALKLMVDFVDDAGVELVDKIDRRMLAELASHANKLIVYSRHASNEQISRAQGIAGVTRIAA